MESILVFLDFHSGVGAEFGKGEAGLVMMVLKHAIVDWIAIISGQQSV